MEHATVLARSVNHALTRGSRSGVARAIRHAANGEEMLAFTPICAPILNAVQGGVNEEA